MELVHREWPETQTQGDSSGAQMVKNLPAMWETQFPSLGWKHPWRREWQLTPIFLPEELHEQRILVGYSPRGGKELDMTERLTLSLHFQTQGLLNRKS